MHLTHVLRFWIKINLYNLKSPLIKEERLFFSQDFINNHYNSDFKDFFLCLIIFGELIIDHFEYALDPYFEVLDKNKPLQINISTNKRGNGNFFGTSLITVLIKLSKTIVYCV